jgi:hypothetical protein
LHQQQDQLAEQQADLERQREQLVEQQRLLGEQRAQRERQRYIDSLRSIGRAAEAQRVEAEQRQEAILDARRAAVQQADSVHHLSVEDINRQVVALQNDARLADSTKHRRLMRLDLRGREADSAWRSARALAIHRADSSTAANGYHY